MVRVITQDTYDEIVKENIDEFDMSPEDAIKEAIAQFEAQGVDLSNIIKDSCLSPGEEHTVSIAILNLKDLWNSSNKNTEEIKSHLKTLKLECGKDVARKLRASKDGAYELLLDILESSLGPVDGNSSNREHVLTVPVLETLFALMDMYPDLLEQRGVNLIKKILNDVKDEDVLVATLKWTAACCQQHEKNRQMLFGQDIVKILKMLLQEQTNTKVISEALLVIRRLCLDDDIRVQFGNAHVHATEIALHTLDTLVSLLKDARELSLVSDLMLTLATLLVRNEFCQSVSDAGGTEVLLSVLKDNYDHTSVVHQAFKLLKALAGNDDVKRLLVTNGVAPLLVLVINHNMSYVSTVAIGLQCIAALSLREPSHSDQFLQNGGPDVIADAMNRYPDNAAVQRSACWAIRNIVARFKEQNTKFVELGVEQYLNDAFKKFENEFGYEIKSALRDLECDVKLQEQWTGKGVQLQHD